MLTMSEFIFPASTLHADHLRRLATCLCECVLPELITRPRYRADLTGLQQIYFVSHVMQKRKRRQCPTTVSDLLLRWQA